MSALHNKLPNQSRSHKTELLPWHNETYEHLCHLNTEQTLGHAYLLEGQSGLGKLSLARHLAHYLLCEDPDAFQACNKCHSCHLFAAGNHPDLKLLEPEEDKKIIGIDQVRSALEFMANTSLIGGRKIIIISPAEMLNINSSNALLKLLEEPPAGSLLLLVSHQPRLLMPTIKSRCQKLKFSPPSSELAITWLQSKNISGSAEILLKLSRGAPLTALLLADEDAIHERSVLHSILDSLLKGEMTASEAASKCDKFSIADNIDGMMLCIADILEYQQSKQQRNLSEPELMALTSQLSGPTIIKALHRSYQELLRARSTINTTANPNPQLIMESLLYNWSRLGQKSLIQ